MVQQLIPDQWNANLDSSMSCDLYFLSIKYVTITVSVLEGVVDTAIEMWYAKAKGTGSSSSIQAPFACLASFCYTPGKAPDGDFSTRRITKLRHGDLWKILTKDRLFYGHHIRLLFCYFFLKKRKLFKRYSDSTVHSPDSCHIQAWYRLRPRTWNSILGPHVWRGPFSSTCPGSLAGSWIKKRMQLGLELAFCM